jgi:dethiobiotin synthetase
VEGEIIFVTGIGTGIGKTVVSAVLTEALQADYWKPIQSGLEELSDTAVVRSLVSNQYLGNINHSLLTAEVLRYKALPVLGWIFNGTYHVNEEDIVRWSGLEKIGRIEQEDLMDAATVSRYAEKLKPRLERLLS